MAARRHEILLVAFVLVFSLAFAAFTQHEWEDYWITFRASRNLAEGNGLVFTPGERVHTFTSPLGTLLPALLSLATGNHNDLLVLWLFRVLSAGALATGMVLIFRTLQALECRKISIWFTLLLIGLDAKIVDFTINGMETGLMILFLALTIHGLLVNGERKLWRLGLGWAGLMWTRPDSCVYIAILGAGALWLLRRETVGGKQHDQFRGLLFAGLICTLVYLPWFLWAWSYYGTPVPHTIVAKATNAPPRTVISLALDLVTFPFDVIMHFSSAITSFLPAYGDRGWNIRLAATPAVLSVVAAFAWTLPVLRPPARLLSFTFFFGNFYLSDVLKYAPPWYLPHVAVLGYLAVGLLFDQVIQFAPKLPGLGLDAGWFARLESILLIAAVLLLMEQAFVTGCVAWQLRIQQQLIENDLRRTIGLWLRAHARSVHDTVMMEPLGYIGYYSGLKTLDYPGLSSREMVATRKQLGRENQNQACRVLKPDWLVLRPIETERSYFVEPAEIREHYELVQVFDATQKIKAVRWLPGRLYLESDQTFMVFHRKPDTADSVGPSGEKH